MIFIIKIGIIKLWNLRIYNFTRDGNMQERLQKYLAECGIASRRKCEELINSGFIKVNGEIVTEMGMKIDTEKDVIKYKDKTVGKCEDKVYIMLNKPTGYVTTTKEQFNRKKVTDLIEGKGRRVYPVGRLDYNTSGLLILTNDGELAFKLTHPAHNVDKTYIAQVEGIPGEKELDRLRKGIVIEGYKTSPAEVEMIAKKDNCSVIRITIHEGRNRQVRKMFGSIGHDVKKLKRVAIGELSLGNLKKGEWRYLSEGEVQVLKEL